VSRTQELAFFLQLVDHVAELAAIRNEPFVFLPDLAEDDLQVYNPVLPVHVAGVALEVGAAAETAGQVPLAARAAQQEV